MTRDEALEVWKQAQRSFFECLQDNSNNWRRPIHFFESWWVKYCKDHTPGMDTDDKHIHTHDFTSSNNKAAGWIDATEELPPENEDVICREYGSDHVLVIHWSSDQTMHEGVRFRTKYEFISQVKEWKRLP